MSATERRELQQVNVRLATHVAASLEEKAKSAGMNVSEYVRALVTVNLGLLAADSPRALSQPCGTAPDPSGHGSF